MSRKFIVGDSVRYNQSWGFPCDYTGYVITATDITVSVKWLHNHEPLEYVNDESIFHRVVMTFAGWRYDVD